MIDFTNKSVVIESGRTSFSLPKGEKAMEPCGFFHFVGIPYKWYRTYGYEHLSVYANEETENYTGKGIAKTENGTVQRVDIEIKKPRKITIAELEKHFGYPIEIVS